MGGEGRCRRGDAGPRDDGPACLRDERPASEAFQHGAVDGADEDVGGRLRRGGVGRREREAWDVREEGEQVGQGRGRGRGRCCCRLGVGVAAGQLEGGEQPAFRLRRARAVDVQRGEGGGGAAAAGRVRGRERAEDVGVRGLEVELEAPDEGEGVWEEGEEVREEGEAWGGVRVGFGGHAGLRGWRWWRGRRGWV